MGDRRGMGGGGLAIGGVGGLIVLAAALFFNVDLSGLPIDGITGGGGTGGTSQSQLREECQTGADANEREDCQILGFENSLHTYWSGTVEGYQEAGTIIFSNSTQTGCGGATSAVGPFYCPADSTIYLDLEFFDVMRSQLGAQDAPLARGYVLAHEYGHHVQNITGQLSGSRGAGAESQAVRTELQADCYAGVWAQNAEETGFLEQITREQIATALNAAAAVGDDRIQEQTQGQVNPETWTHGSSEQRQQWFLVGYESGDPNRCDTSGEI